MIETHGKEVNRQMVSTKIVISLIIFCLFSQVTALPTPDEWKVSASNKFTTLTKEEVDTFISPLITYNQSKGLMIVLVDENGYAIYSYGVADALSGSPPDNTTLYDIGSVSKVMTGLLMADADISGVYNISAPVNTYLPAEYALPDDEGDITGIHLATHRSGLPGIPDAFTEVNPVSSDADKIEESMQHYQSMTAEETYKWIATIPLVGPPGYDYLYSNLGSAIAGDVVARAQGKLYPNLLAERILIPLGMIGSGALWTREDLNRRGTGYRAYAYPTDEARLIRFNEFWTAGGGIHSNADDMAVFLGAQMGLIETPLTEAIEKTHIPYDIVTAGPPMIKQGLFWEILYNRDGTTILKKAGETNAHQADIAFNPLDKTGVVILSNTATMTGTHVEEFAIALLERMQVKKNNQIT